MKEMFLVSSVNGAAFIMSFSDVEQTIRIAGLAAAFVWTCIRIFKMLNEPITTVKKDDDL